MVRQSKHFALGGYSSSPRTQAPRAQTRQPILRLVQMLNFGKLSTGTATGPGDEWFASPNTSHLAAARHPRERGDPEDRQSNR